MTHPVVFACSWDTLYIAVNPRISLSGGGKRFSSSKSVIRTNFVVYLEAVQYVESSRFIVFNAIFKPELVEKAQ